MKYHYYAICEKDEDGYSISFPDLPGCFTCAKEIEEALKMAKDALEGHLLILEEDNDTIEPASPYKELNKKLEDNQVLQLITADTDFVRMREKNKSVNKMVTLPKWLIDLGKEKKINFSQVLQEAVKRELNIE